MQITASVKDGSGNALPAAVTWRSASTTIASVSSSGLVTAMGNGTTTVTANAGSASASVSVVVRQEPRSLVVTPAQALLSALGETFALTAAITDALGNAVNGLTISWSSTANPVATVDGSGTVTAVTNGVATVIATIGALADSVQVTVAQQASQVALSPTSMSLTASGAPGTATATVSDARGNRLTGAAVTWSSSNTSVVTVAPVGESQALVTAIGSGTASIAARAGSITGSLSVTVVAPPGTMVVEPIDAYLSTPSAGYESEIPVLVIRYLPTKDGNTLDIDLTAFPRPPSHPGAPALLSDVRKRIDVFDRRVKFMLEEGSRFRGYANPQSPPALGYRIVHYVTVYDPLPLGKVAGQCVPAECTGTAHFPDYHAILSRVNASHWVNVRGVKEIWLWGWHYARIVPDESNMASPTTGDVSNSYRWNDDLPVYNRTYTLYMYNYGRAQNEAVHNHGHQLEAILGYADNRQNGNDDLFWRSFVGRNGSNWTMGRAGWTHMPPNTTDHYGYWSLNSVSSDIEDWRADNSGTKSSISSNRWRNLVYNWPPGEVPLIDGRREDFDQGSNGRTEAQWYIYWMQNMPGRGSNIPLFAGKMTNWWTFTADWDSAIQSNVGLATVPNGLPISIRNDYAGGAVSLNPGGSLETGQTRTLYANTPLTVSVWDCGEPGGCKWDPYVLTPGKNYRVISHPNGPSHNTTIVEQ